jgi:antitoxin component of RelBE/YafQ-DinJ toxin-antitoxin module
MEQQEVYQIRITQKLKTDALKKANRVGVKLAEVVRQLLTSWVEK